MRTLVLTLAAAFALSAAAAAQTYGPSPVTPSPAASTPASPAPAPATSAAPNPGSSAAASAAPVSVAVVHVKNFVFVPETVTVAAGQPVRFVQDDATPHTVTASDKSFDSGNLDEHAVWSHTFTKPGTYAYFCAYHTYMKGTVVVK